MVVVVNEGKETHNEIFYDVGMDLERIKKLNSRWSCETGISTSSTRDMHENWDGKYCLGVAVPTVLML